MLILSRKPNESLVIEAPGAGEPIEIVVTEVNAGQVRLGIKAHKDCKIWRKELYLTIQQNLQAAGAAGTAGIRSMASHLSGAGARNGDPSPAQAKESTDTPAAGSGGAGDAEEKGQA